MSLTRRFPEGWRVRRAQLDDAQRLSKLLRPADLSELEALEGRSALTALEEAVGPPCEAEGPLVRALTIGGDAVAIYGLVGCEGVPGHATPWTALSRGLSEDQLGTLMWLSRWQLNAWQRHVPVLQTVCDSRNLFHRQWLEWLGFVRVDHLDRFGAAQIPFDLFVRRRTDAVTAARRASH